MDLTEIKRQIKHIDKHPESLTHCNGLDMAYFLPKDVRALIAEVERLALLCNEYRGEVASARIEIRNLRTSLTQAQIGDCCKARSTTC